MVHGHRRYATLGDASTMTLPEARREARRLIASYFEPVTADSGPRTPGHPMTAFAEEFLERHSRHWKPSHPGNQYAAMVRNHILPAFGHMTVDAITAEQVKDWFASMRDRPGIANRAMPVLSVMMRMAELWGYRRHNTNPCKKTKRYRMKPKERYLSAEEMARLNAVLTRDEFWCPNVVAIIRLLMLTGCRFGEIASLEWDWIKGQADFPPRFQVRAAHGLAVERRPGDHRRHPALQRGLPVSISGSPADAADPQHLFPLDPYPRPGGTARPAASRPAPHLGIGRRHERRGHGDHRQALGSRAGRDDGAIRPPVRPVRYSRPPTGCRRILSAALAGKTLNRKRRTLHATR